uniref:Uncharacterized protein n=1 Tax=Timema bartmani TaxID=61472 RepID=A0A7R9HZM4_9NEOP|nr:unnamed protein product [Timema bartmani]
MMNTGICLPTARICATVWRKSVKGVTSPALSAARSSAGTSADDFTMFMTDIQELLISTREEN